MKRSLSLKVRIPGVAAVVLLLGAVASGYYYEEDFSTGAPGWDLGYRYGRAGITHNSSTLTVSAPGTGTGNIEFRGLVIDWDVHYRGIWAGRMALYTNASFVASRTNPFGVEFRRTFARIDCHNDSWFKESHRHMAAMSFWLVSDPDNLDDDTDPEFSSFPDFMVMYEMMRMEYNTGSGQPRSTWGVDQGSEQRFDLTRALRPDGSTLNIIDNTTYGLEWNYEDYWGDVVTAGAGGSDNPNADNNNPVVIRLTHNGSTIGFYINPNPDDDGSNPYPNEFLLVGTAAVDWGSAIKFMVGVESKQDDTEKQDADIDNLLVRSVAGSIKAELSPARIARGTTNTFQLVVAPVFTADHAGIGELVISKPSGYAAIDWDISSVQVFTDKGTGTNHGVITGLQRMIATASVPTANNQVYITTNSNELKLRFRQAANSLTDTGVINSQTGGSADDKKIVVLFVLPSPDTGNAAGESFTVAADCVKYDGQSYPRWSTTGAMQAVAGDAHTGGYPDDTLTVQRYGNPDALATLCPELIYIGNDRTIYLYVATTNENAPPISELRIQVPEGYTVSSLDSSRFSSLYIVDDTHVFVTNESGTNYIYVRYAADSGGLGLPGSGGLDRITIQVESTPTGFSGAETNTTWTATAYSSLAGTIGTLCRTNSMYPNRNVTVRTLPPDVTGVVTTSLVENGTNYVYNHQHVNAVSYSVVNNGGAGNTIKRIRVKFPSCVNGADCIASTTMGAAVINYLPGINGFIIDYGAAGKSIDSGASDTITFDLHDTVIPMSDLSSGSITVEADNENGDGYVAGQEGSGSWCISWKRPSAAGNAAVSVQNSQSFGSTNIIPTTDVVSTIKLSIVNTGGTSNSIQIAEIQLPAQFTDVLSASSLKMFNSGTNISYAGGVLRIRYYENSVGPLQNTENDILTLQVVDNVGLTGAGTASFIVKVGNTTNFSETVDTALIPEGSKELTFRIPDALATGYAVPVNIDSSTITNTMTYVLSNSAAYENYLGEVRIYIPDSVASNIIDPVSTHLSLFPANVTVHAGASTNYIRLLYQGASLLYGGQSDIVTFKMIDHIETATSFYLVAAATNVRNEWKELSVAAGQTNRVVIEIPPASASADITPNVYYTHSAAVTNLIVLSLTNTGTGGNNISNAVISFPAALQDKVLSISNERGCGIVLADVPRTITLHYTNAAELLAGQGDRIYIAFENDISTVQSGFLFTGTVDNGQGPVSIGTIAAGSLEMHFVEQPGVEIFQSDATPGQIYSTDDESTFTYKIYNGQSVGMPVRGVLIELPYPFTSDSIQIIPSWPGASVSVVNTNIYAFDGTQINTAGDEKIYLNYSANDLDAGSVDVISLIVRDDLLCGETNVSWSGWVDYGDGYGLQPAVTRSGGSCSIQFVFPDASGQAAISPRRVNINTASSVYNVTITNTGLPGNHIQMVEITLPLLFTNISGLSSSLAGTVLSNQGNRIFAVYTPATNLLSSSSDVISFTGVDNISSLTNVTVAVRVANATNASLYRDAGTISPDSLDMEFYKLDYFATAFIRPLDPISDSRPDTIFSTTTTSTLQFTLVNNGAPGNDLEELKIYIADTVFDPATFAGAASTRVPGSQIVRSGSVITVYYTNTGEPLLANQSDVLTFVINDLVTCSNACSHWHSASRFSTSGAVFLTNQTATGKTNGIHLQMPQPQAVASLKQNEVYTSTRRFGLVLLVSNTGCLNNALKRVMVSIPSALQGGLSVGSVSNSSATNISYAAGVFTFFYDGVDAGQTDAIYMHLSNACTTAAALPIAVTVNNALYSAPATELPVNSLQLKAVTPPSGYVEVTSPEDGVYNRLYSTEYQNEVKVYIRNDGTGGWPVNQALIIAPEGFTVSAASSRIGAGSVTVSSNVVALDYQGGGSPVQVSETDTVTLQIIAPFFKGGSNVQFGLQVGDVNSSALNPGCSTARLYTGKSWEIGYFHPAPAADFYLSGYAAGIRPFIYVAPDSGIATTNLSIRVGNIGSCSNVITNLIVTLPDAFSTVSAPASSAGGVCSVNGGTITVDYTASPLATGVSDDLTFTVEHAQRDALTDLLFSASVDNGSTYGLTAATLSSGWFQHMDIKYPPLSVFSGVVNTASVYTIFTNATLSYQIKNSAQGYRVTKVVLTNFYAGVFSNVTFSSPEMINIPETNASGTVTLNFDSASGIDFSEIETVTIGLSYQVPTAYVTTLTLQAICTLTNAQLGIQTNIRSGILESIDTDIGNADNQRVFFGPAPFASIRGTVAPVFKVDTLNPGSVLPNIVQVEVLSSSNDQVITTPYARTAGSGIGLVGKSLQTYTDPDGGRYTINYVPEGSYRIRLSAHGFKTTYTNVTITSNAIITIPELTMRNALLDSESFRQQIVMDPNNTNTRFVMDQGELLGQFSLDISVVDMSTAMENDVQTSSVVRNLTATGSLGCFSFELFNTAGSPVDGMRLADDATLVLQYSSAGLNLPVGTDWSASDLAIYYWKESSGNWIPIGGAVDTSAETVSAKINYLHRYYALLSMKANAEARPIYNVTSSPNPFTPGRGGEQSSSVRLSFSFSRPHSSYTVAIFTMRGQRVRLFKRDGSLAQGELFWDGKHESGFGLPGGVYIYQIKAGGQTYSGSILMLK